MSTSPQVSETVFVATPQVMAPARVRRRWTISRLAVLTLAAVAILDLGLRFLPLTWYDMLDFQIARKWRPPDSPFPPNLTLRTAYYSGDEAVVGNLPQPDLRPPKLFRTDSMGFRFTPPVRPGEPPQVLVLRGFSYTFGAHLDEHETIAAALSRELGVNVYNAARFHEDDETPDDVRRLLSRLDAHPSLAVYVHLEPNAHEIGDLEPKPIDRRGAAVLGAERYSKIVGAYKYFRIAIPTWVRVSPLNMFTVRWNKALYDDSILPNHYRDNIVSFPIPGGRAILNRKGDLLRVQTPVDDRTVAARAAYIEHWSRGLGQQGMKTIVLLVPEKMSVYGPALGVPVPTDPYLNRLERELRKRGVEVVNGLPMLLAGAPQDIATGKLAYFDNDHHWNADGVARLAALVRQNLDRLQALAPDIYAAR